MYFCFICSSTDALWSCIRTPLSFCFYLCRWPIKWSSIVTASTHKACGEVPCVCVLFCKSMHLPSLILNMMLLMHAAVSCCLFHKVTASTCMQLLGYVFYQPHALTARLQPASMCFSDSALTQDLQDWCGKKNKKSRTALVPGTEMQSTPLGVSLDPVFLSAPPGWDAVNTTTTEKENQSSPPTSPINVAHLLTEETLVRQQLKPLPPDGGAEGWVCANHRSINLISIHSPLCASHWRSSSGGVDCVDWMLAVITIIFARDALHMTEKKWASILSSLMTELCNK